MNNEPTIRAIKFTYRANVFTEDKPGLAPVTLVYHRATIDHALNDLRNGEAIFVDATDANALAIIRAQAPSKPSRMTRLWRWALEQYWS